MIYLAIPPNPSEGGSAHATLRYTTGHFGGNYGQSTEYPPAPAPWWKRPRDMEDAGKAVLGARSRLWIPGHDIAYGPYGPDSKDFVRSSTPTTLDEHPGEDVWPF